MGPTYSDISGYCAWRSPLVLSPVLGAFCPLLPSVFIIAYEVRISSPQSRGGCVSHSLRESPPLQVVGGGARTE